MASTENTQAASPFGRRWLISGAVVLLALALAVFLAVRGGADKQPADTAATASSAPPAGVASQNTDTTPGKCSPAKSGKAGIPAKAPAVRWERHPSGAVVPVSGEAGPFMRGDGYWTCSAHTTAGALVAGLSRTYNFVTGDVMSGNETPNRDAFFQANQLKDTARFGTVEGYRVLLAGEKEAMIEYLFSLDGQYAAMRVALVWDEKANDWLLNTASKDLSMFKASAPENYTTWR